MSRHTDTARNHLTKELEKAQAKRAALDEAITSLKAAIEALPK